MTYDVGNFKVIIFSWVNDRLNLAIGKMYGFAAELLEPEFGIDAIRYATRFTMPVNLWCAFHYYMCTRTLKHSLENAPT